MKFIGTSFQRIEGWLEEYSMEVFSKYLKREWIEEALQEAGRQSRRERKLNGVFTVWVIIGMGLYRNLSIQNVIRRLGNLLGVGSLWKNGEAPKSSSDAQARDRVGVQVLRVLLGKMREWVLKVHHKEMTWRGLLVLAVDGTTFKTWDSQANRRHWGFPGSSPGKSRAAYPQMRGVALVCTKLRIVLQAAFAPYREGEITIARKILETIPQGAVVLLDAYYTMWDVVHRIEQRQSHILLRAKKRFRGKEVSRLGRGDRWIEAKVRPAARCQFRDLPKKMLLREITVRIQTKEFRFVTTLLDPQKYPAEELVQLYRDRWEEEIAFDEMKTHQGGVALVSRPVLFRCRTPQRVLQEAYGLVLAYNLVRLVITEAAMQSQVSPLRISFVDSLEHIRTASLLMASAETRLLPLLFEDLLRILGARLLPPRRDRHHPREVCIKSSRVPTKRKAS